MNDQKQLQINEKGKRELSAKNLKYIQLRLQDGMDPQQAYIKAGYSGTSYSAPYEMEHYLKDEMQKIMEASGINYHNLMLKSKKLIDLPVCDEHGNKLQNVTFNQHIKALTLAHKLIPENSTKRPVISPIIIKTGNGPTLVNVGDTTEKTTPEHQDTNTPASSEDKTV